MAAGQRPELRELVSALSNLSWDRLKEVVLHLGVPKNKLDDIEAMYPTSVGSRRMSALDCWLQMDVGASWRKLVGTLRALNLSLLVVVIEDKYLGKKPISFTGGGPIPTAENACVPKLTDQPTLAQLRKLKLPDGKYIRIIDQVASKWDEIAIEMDFDPVGHTQSAIDKDFGTVQEKCTATFKKWLQGTGGKQPPRWDTLAEILRECKFKDLATSIETALY